jgi:hypothetical protein
VIPGELRARNVQECDSKGVIGVDFVSWVVRCAYRSSILGKRWRDLVAGDWDGFFSLRVHWLHVAIIATGGQEITLKLAVRR